MEVPVCLDGCCVGEMSVMPAGRDTELRVRCTGLPAGLYRLYACGAGGELLLGVTEDGCLHRRFSAAMTAPLGTVTRCRAQPVQGAAWRALAPSDGLPWPVPAGALLRREGASAQVAVPWPQDAPFPLTELFCFASVGQREGKRYVFYAFSGNWTPLMPGKTRKS